jgi:hypothetical protein
MKEPIGNLRNIIENKLRTWWEHKNTKSIIKKNKIKFANTNFHTIWRMYFIQNTFYRPILLLVGLLQGHDGWTDTYNGTFTFLSEAF